MSIRAIITVDGSPMSDVRFQAIRGNWIINDLSTKENGVFDIEVIPGEDFKLKAYYYEDKYGAESGTVSAVLQGNYGNLNGNNTLYINYPAVFFYLLPQYINICSN